MSMWEVAMKPAIAVITMIFFLLAGGSNCGAEGGTAATFIAKGDAAYKKFDNRAAVKYYRTAFETEPKNYEAAWKLARAYVDVGEKLSDTKERRVYYEKGYDCAQKAVAINPDGSKGHLFLSIAIGRVALDAGAKERVKLSKEVKSEVDKALALLGGVPKEASMQNAVDCFKKAIQLNPAHINHHLELGITYEEMGKKDLAVAAYRNVLELPIGDADDQDHKKEAEERLKKMGRPVFRQSRYKSPLTSLK